MVFFFAIFFRESRRICFFVRNRWGGLYLPARRSVVSGAVDRRPVHSSARKPAGTAVVTVRPRYTHSYMRPCTADMGSPRSMAGTGLSVKIMVSTVAGPLRKINSHTVAVTGWYVIGGYVIGAIVVLGR